MESDPIKQQAILIVAHPDDETIWAGGQVLAHSDWDWYIFSLCRGNDPDRAPKFFRVLNELGARGSMADVDDEPEQLPLDLDTMMEVILSGIPEQAFDYCLTHSPDGEYTRHRRHEEVSRAVQALWMSRKLESAQLWMFAYEDDGRKRLPRANPGAHRVIELGEQEWEKKYCLITEVYGFTPESWEARTTPAVEAFWCFDRQEDLAKWNRIRDRQTR